MVFEWIVWDLLNDFEFVIIKALRRNQILCEQKTKKTQIALC